MRAYFLILTLISLLISCQTNKQSSAEIEQLTATIEEKIELFFESQNFDNWSISQEEKENITEFYQNRNFAPKWITEENWNSQGKKVNQIIQNTIFFGLPQKRYLFESDTISLLENEIKTSVILSRIASDLKNGIFIKDTCILKPIQYLKSDTLSKKLLFQDSISIEKQLINWGPSNQKYQEFALALFSFCKTYPIQKEQYSIKPEKIDSLNSLKESFNTLIQKGFLKDTIFDTIRIRESIKKYQELHHLEADGKIGYKTCKILNESNFNKVVRAAITLDKIRTHNNYPPNFIQVNLPYYHLTYTFNDTIRSQNRVIIGSTKTASPKVNSIIKYIVIYPFWRVPYSIASKELLPKIQKDSNYLAKNNYKVYKKDIEQNPKDINWNALNENKFPYRIVQDYGPENSLGLFKLSFNNPYWIYVHDTPNKRLFNKGVRAMSHGCIRCDSIKELVTEIIYFDRQYIKDDTLNIDTILKNKEQKVIHLRNPLPIFIEYQTVVYSDHQLKFLIDIYRKDEGCIQKFINPN